MQEELVKLFMTPQLGQRDIVIHTGIRGAELFHLELRREAVRKQLSYAASIGVVTPVEVLRLTEMIQSDDPGNITVAESVIEAKLEMNNHGSNI